MPDSVPEGWQRVHLGEISRAVGGVGFPIERQGLSHGKWPMVKVSDLNRPENAREVVTAEHWLDEERRAQIGARILPPGTVVFPKVGAALMSERRRRLGVAAALDNNLMGLQPDEETVLSEYLLLLLHRVKLAGLAQTTALPSINQSLVSSLEVLLPPLEEQRAIAAVLDAVDDTIERTETVIAATEELRRALLHELLTRGVPGMHSEWRDVPGLGTVPACWEVTTLGEVISEPIRNGFSPGTVEEPTGWFVLTLGAVSHRGFVPGARKPTRPDPRVQAAQLEPGDLLVSRSNTSDRVGLAGIYRGVPQNCSYPDLLMRVRVDPGTALVDFVEAALLSIRGRSYFERQARGTSGSMVKITGDILRAFPIAVPSIEEQCRIVDALTAATTNATSEQRALAKAKVLKEGLAVALLTGERRIADTAVHG